MGEPHVEAHSQIGENDLRVRALESVLVEKGYVDPAALDELIDTYETRIGPRNGARVVAKAWVDPDFRDWLTRDATAAIASLGYRGRQGEHMIALPYIEQLVRDDAGSINRAIAITGCGPLFRAVYVEVHKNADLSALTQDELNAVATKLNHRPRRVLGWATPAEAFDNCRAQADTASACVAGAVLGCDHDRMAASGLPELDIARVQAWCATQVPEHARSEIRVECDVAARHLTICECRPPWREDLGPDWTRFPIARLHYTKTTRLWTLYWRDRNTAETQTTSIPG